MVRSYFLDSRDKKIDATIFFVLILKGVKMYKIVASATLLALLSSSLLAGKIGSDCTYRGKKMYGKVKIVNSFPGVK